MDARLILKYNKLITKARHELMIKMSARIGDIMEGMPSLQKSSAFHDLQKKVPGEASSGT